MLLQDSTSKIISRGGVPTAEPMAAFPGMTFGCDPEFFIYDGDDKPVCAYGLIPGTKEDPHRVDKGAVQVDGMAAEFNIDPAATWEEFSGNIDTVVEQLAAMLPDGHYLSPVASTVFDEETFNSSPVFCRTLGCSPDFNAWTGQPNTPPHDEDVPFGFRTAGGHLHFGWNPKNPSFQNIQYVAACRDLVKQLDWYLGLWSLTKDYDGARRALYGQAGTMRFKPYGVEYRTLSNFWVLDKQIRLATWNRMQQALQDMRNGFMPDHYYDWSQSLQDSINQAYIPGAMKKRFSFVVDDIIEERPQ